MSAVTWMCAVCIALAFLAIALGYVSAGVIGVTLSSVLAWYDWRAFGIPPSDPHWWSRFGPRPPDDGGGSNVPAPIGPGPNAPAGARALELPTIDED